MEKTRCDEGGAAASCGQGRWKFGHDSAYLTPIDSSPNWAIEYDWIDDCWTSKLNIVLTSTFLPPLLERVFRAYKADCDNYLKFGTLRSDMTLSKTIPTTIFTILASYALWESHAPYKKRQRLRQTVAFIYFLCVWVVSWSQGYNNQLPGNIEAWRIPGTSYAAHEQIWINLDKVFRDAGFTLWPNALFSILRIADYPSSGGFGYAIPTRGKEGVGSLKKLRQYNYHVCSFICLFNPCLMSIDRIHFRELHVPKVDSMSSSVLSLLEKKGLTIWKSSRQLQPERTACWALTILFLCLWNFSLKISFSVFSPWLEERCRMRSASGRIILSETSLICLCKCWR